MKMTDERMIIDPRLGDAVCEAIQNMTGHNCHVIIIACPIVQVDDEHESIGQPSFVTSLQPDDMEELLIQIAGGMAVAGKRVVTGSTVQ